MFLIILILCSWLSETTAEMKTQGTFIGLDFTNVGDIDPAINDGYPYLGWKEE